MNRLDEIISAKRIEVEKLRPHATALDRQARARNDFRGFHRALSGSGKLRVIAEVKKASPSAGVIAKSFDPVAIAKDYERAGASAISVLTDAYFFHGALEHLIEVRRAVSLPILRKDFTIDEIQIAESAANGADAILLIVAALEQNQLVDLSAVAAGYRLDALIEVHSAHELERALDANAKIIGINNRDLATFDVDLAVTETLSAQIPNDIIVISESGIRTRDDIERIKHCRVDAMLVGEALMRGELSIAEIR